MHTMLDRLFSRVIDADEAKEIEREINEAEAEAQAVPEDHPPLQWPLP